MCQEIQVGERDITNIGELKAEIGRRNLVIYPGYRNLNNASCLCPVDIAASARKAGRDVRKSEWPMEWIMEPRP
jgi:hypothetical protein